MPQGFGDRMTPKLCKTCGKESRGICVERRDEFRHLGYDYYCSIKCRDAKIMTDWTIRERTAMMRGGRMGGEYLESINKFSLDTLTEEEWNTFLSCIFKEFFYAMSDPEVLHSAELFS